MKSANKGGRKQPPEEKYECLKKKEVVPVPIQLHNYVLPTTHGTLTTNMCQKSGLGTPMFSRRGQSTIPGTIVFHEGRQDEVRKMILERQIKKSEEYAIEMYRKKKEEKTPTPNALEVDPVMVYNDIMDES